MAEIIKYPDGSSYAKIHMNEVRGMPNIPFTFRINSYNDLWELNQIVDAYNNINVTPNVLIPNLLDAQADRRFDEGESSGLKLVCKFLNGMDANFKIFHPHNAEVVEALMDNVTIIDNKEFITDVIADHIELTNGELILMSPDAGAFKPLVKLANSLDWQGEIYSAVKSRDPKTGMLTQEISREDFGGKDILIIDDLIVGGGTLKGLATLLKERNCGKIYAAASHMTVQNLCEDPVADYFDKVFITNSKFEEYYGPLSRGTIQGAGCFDQPENLEIIRMF